MSKLSSMKYFFAFIMNIRLVFSYKNIIMLFTIKYDRIRLTDDVAFPQLNFKSMLDANSEHELSFSACCLVHIQHKRQLAQADPTSNISTKAVQRFADHFLKSWYHLLGHSCNETGVSLISVGLKLNGCAYVKTSHKLEEFFVTLQFFLTTTCNKIDISE